MLQRCETPGSQIYQQYISDSKGLTDVSAWVWELAQLSKGKFGRISDMQYCAIGSQQPGSLDWEMTFFIKFNRN